MRVVSKGFSMKGTILVKRHTKGFARQRGHYRNKGKVFCENVV